MNVKVAAKLGTDKYYTEITAGNNKLFTDETESLGGKNRGLNPFELLAASLASCTATTLRMYIDRKGWAVPEILVDVELENFPLSKRAVFTRKISYANAELDEAQLQRLHQIADSCPIHKLLQNEVEIKTEFGEGN